MSVKKCSTWYQELCICVHNDNNNHNNKCEDHDTAEPILKKAIDLNPTNQVALLS